MNEQPQKKRDDRPRRSHVTIGLVLGFIAIAAVAVMIGRAASPAIEGPGYAIAVVGAFVVLFLIGSTAVGFVQRRSER